MAFVAQFVGRLVGDHDVEFAEPLRPVACVVHAAEVDGNGDVAGHRSVLAFVVTGSGDAVIRSDYQNDAAKNARFVTSWTLAAVPGTPINALDIP